MEMTDVYWLLISYYLNLAASKKAIHAHFSCKEKGGLVGRGGKKDGKVGEEVGKYYGDRGQSEIKRREHPCLYFNALRVSRRLKQFIYL